MNKKQARQQPLDSVIDLVLRGHGHLIDTTAFLDAFADRLKPFGCSNYQYRFVWNHECDPDEIEINWDRLNARLLKQAIKNPNRLVKIEQGGRLTAKESREYRLAVARQRFGYRSAEERLNADQDLNWVDVVVVSDSKGREIYLLQIREAVEITDEAFDQMSGKEFMDWHDRAWNVTPQPMIVIGPFASLEDAENWMTSNGAFDEED